MCAMKITLEEARRVVYTLACSAEEREMPKDIIHKAEEILGGQFKVVFKTIPAGSLKDNYRQWWNDCFKVYEKHPISWKRNWNG